MEEGFTPTIRAIKKWDAAVRKELRAEIRGAMNEIADGARARGDSEKIAGTVKTRTRIESKQVVGEVHAGSSAVPEAGLRELGNKGSHDREKFRHPVFGDRGNWVSQKMHRFVAPAVVPQSGFALLCHLLGISATAAVEAPVGGSRNA